MRTGAASPMAPAPDIETVMQSQGTINPLPYGSAEPVPLPRPRPAEGPQLEPVPLPRERPKVSSGADYEFSSQSRGPSDSFLEERKASAKVRTEQLDPEFRARLSRIIRDAEAATGQKVQINSGSRTNEEQREIYRRSGQGRAFMAARPGYSRHEVGRAVDIQPGKALDWIRKNVEGYGLQKLSMRDPVHIQMPRSAKEVMQYDRGFEAPVSPMKVGARSQTAQTESEVAPVTPVVAGNIDLAKQPVVEVPGGRATIRSIGVNIDGQETLLPTVSDRGELLTEVEAIQRFLRTGKHLGKFDSVEDAKAYAKWLSSREAKRTSPK